MTGKCACVLLFLCIATLAHAQDEDLMKQDSIKRGDTLRVLPAVDTTRKHNVAPISDSSVVDESGPVTRIKSYATRFNPRKAILYAAILPGSGQVYNKKYWKAPIVWGGFGFLIYAVAVSQQQYTSFKDQLFDTINEPWKPTSSGYSQEQLRTLVDEARRQRDYYLILNFFWYILQMVDAHVDAHLKEFDLNPSLKVSVEPRGTGPGDMVGRSTGVALVFRFR
jgi:hypothetical protein